MQGQVLAHCRRAFLRDPHTAQEVAAAVARRAWEKLSTFHGQDETKFLAWVMTITQTAIIDHVRGRKSRAKWEVQAKQSELDSISSAPDLPATENQPGMLTLMQLLAEAILAHLMSQQDATVLRQRVRNPPTNWEEVGRLLDIGVNAATLCHKDALRKLPVALFLLCPACCGGPKLIAEAFGRAQTGDGEPLTAAEIKIFELLVIQRQPLTRQAVRSKVLRSACGKVALCLRSGSSVLLGWALS